MGLTRWCLCGGRLELAILLAIKTLQNLCANVRVVQYAVYDVDTKFGFGVLRHTGCC